MFVICIGSHTLANYGRAGYVDDPLPKHCVYIAIWMPPWLYYACSSTVWWFSDHFFLLSVWSPWKMKNIAIRRYNIIIYCKHNIHEWNGSLNLNTYYYACLFLLMEQRNSIRQYEYDLGGMIPAQCSLVPGTRLSSVQHQIFCWYTNINCYKSTLAKINLQLF